jgi:hypothetical protein
MLTKGVHNPNFKGFMASSAQANWNAIQIVNGSGDPSEPMVIRNECVTSTRLNLWIDTQINKSNQKCERKT